MNWFTFIVTVLFGMLMYMTGRFAQRYEDRQRAKLRYQWHCQNCGYRASADSQSKLLELAASHNDVHYGLDIFDVRKP